MRLRTLVRPIAERCKKSILADDCTADRYRKAAFVVEVPQDTTSEEVIDQLRKHGQQSK